MGDKMKKSPNIRFKGFSDDWENRKLTDEVELYGGLTYSPNDIVKDGGTLVLRSSNIKNGEVVDADNVYVNSEVVNSDNVQEGDIIIVVRNGSRSLIGKHGQIKVKKDNTVIGAFMTGMRSINSNFINALLDTPNFYKEIEKNLGATINQITNGMFKSMCFMFPSCTEQHKIGTLFQNLDNLITLNQRKLELLKDTKKSMLQKMFPKDGESIPEIRFEGFTDAWEQRKFSNIIQKLTGGASIAPDDYQEKGIRTIPKGAVNSTGVADLSGSKNVTKQFFKQNSSSIVSTNNLVTSLRDLVPSAPNMGRIVRIEGEKEDFLMPQGVYKIELNDRTDENFVIAYSNSERYRKIIFLEKNGSTQVHIRNNEFLNINILIPSYDEQTKLGIYFKQLDNLIALHQRELDLLKDLKKSMLQQMFI